MRITDERLRDLATIHRDEFFPEELRSLVLEVQAARAGLVVMTGGTVTQEQVETLRRAAIELRPVVIDAAPQTVEPITDQELGWLCVALTWYQPTKPPGPDLLGASLADKIVNLRNGYDDLVDRIQTIADEAFGPFTVQAVDENLRAIERGIADQHRRIANALVEFGTLRRTLIEEYPEGQVDRMLDFADALAKRGDLP